MTKPMFKNNSVILIKKTLTVILVGVFLFTNTLSWAKEDRLFSTAIEDKSFSSRSADNTKLAPPSKLNREDFKYSLTAGAICKHIERDGNLDDKSYLNDVLARLDAEKNRSITVLPYEIIIEIPSEGLAIRYFDPTKASVITPYSDISKLSTEVISLRLTRQIIVIIQALPPSESVPAIKSMPQNDAVDIRSEFKEVQGLGSNEIAVFVAKADMDATMRFNRYISLIQAERSGNPYAIPERGVMAKGFVRVAAINEIDHTDKSLWKREELEPRAFNKKNNRAVIGTANALKIINSFTGELLRTITNPKFANIHTIEFSPINDHHALVTSTGTDRIFEIDLDSGNIIWEWNPWANGYAKNKLGLMIASPGQALLLGNHVKIIDENTADKMMISGERVPSNEIWATSVDVSAPRQLAGLKNWQKPCTPNWAVYSDDGQKIIASLFWPGQVVEIDKKTGKTRVLIDGLQMPHGSAFPDGYLISDTGHGRVLVTNKDVKVEKLYDFSHFPERSGLRERKEAEWLQNTYPLTRSLFITVDQRRNTLYIWNPKLKIYSAYPFNTELVLQMVTSFQDKKPSMGMANVVRPISNVAAPAKDVSRNAASRDYIDYVNKHKGLFKDLLGENKPDMLVRIPVEAIESVGIDNVKDLLATFQEAPNGYVELYYASGIGEVGENVYRKYGLQKKSLPKDFERIRENTVTLFPALKGEEINQSTIVSRLGSLDIAPENTILSPIGLQHDPAGLIRAIILGLKIMDIARQIKGGKPIDKDAVHVDILNQLRDVLDPADFKNFDLTPEDIIALATGNINSILSALKKLIKLLPIMPINAEELRQIYEHAKQALIAA
jgi:hypothetical protein